jgi:PAS domain S-box-containing protein
MESQKPGMFEEYYPPRGRWYRVQLYPTEQGLVVLTMEVTAARTALQQEDELSHTLALSEGKLSEETIATLNVMPDPVLVLDGEFRALFYNVAAMKSVGHEDLKEVVGKTPWEIAPVLAGSKLEQAYRQAMADQSEQLIEFHYTAVGKWYRMRVLPSQKQLLITATDISEQKRFESTAELLTKTLDRALDASWDRKSQRDPKNRAHRGK